MLSISIVEEINEIDKLKVSLITNEMPFLVGAKVDDGWLGGPV
jgi:hypothetical protein